MMRPNPANCPCPAKCDEAQTCQGRCSEPVPKPSSEPSDLARRAEEEAQKLISNWFGRWDRGGAVNQVKMAIERVAKAELATALLAAEQRATQAEARAAEMREECAQKCEGGALYASDPHSEMMARRCAELIRAMPPADDRFAKLLTAARKWKIIPKPWMGSAPVTWEQWDKTCADLEDALAAFNPQPATRQREG